jgi:carbamoyltransferase
MKVLGISYGYHDSSACLVADGEVVAASAEERFTRQKHDANFPAYAVRHCLDTARIRAADVDQIVFHEDPHAKFSRVLCAALAPFPASRREFVNSMKAWLGRKLWALDTISSRLDVPPDKITYLGHHYSHAVQAFMGSGFDRSAILVVDAVGDWACTSLYAGEWKDGRPEVRRLLEVAYPNSLGLVYSAFTAWLGFSPNDSECSTMALASFGRPIYADTVRKIIAEAEDTGYQVDQSYFNFQSFYKGAVTEKFLDVFGPTRNFKDKLPFASFGRQGAASADAQRYADGAASIQLVLEERVLALCERLHAAFPCENLCYSGGVAMNCVANSRILAESPFQRVFIPPDPGDGGTAVGTSLYYAAVNAPQPVGRKTYGPYLGAAFDEAPDVAMVDYVQTDHIVPYLKKEVPAVPGVRWKKQTYGSDEELCAEVSRRLHAGAIVGWYQGRAELGPRALGNRSILARPDDVDVVARLSRAVKERAAFRPYALSIAAEAAAEVLQLGRAQPSDARWMQFAFPVQAAVVDRVRCGLHVDGTTRAQVCTAADNPLFHRLLLEFGREFGIPVLINTSFNASGYPIVSTPVDAMSMFARTDMDVLVLNRTLLWKERGA